MIRRDSETSTAPLIVTTTPLQVLSGVPEEVEPELETENAAVEATTSGSVDEEVGNDNQEASAAVEEDVDVLF